MTENSDSGYIEQKGGYIGYLPINNRLMPVRSENKLIITKRRISQSERSAFEQKQDEILQNVYRYSAKRVRIN